MTWLLVAPLRNHALLLVEHLEQHPFLVQVLSTSPDAFVGLVVLDEDAVEISIAVRKCIQAEMRFLPSPLVRSETFLLDAVEKRSGDVATDRPGVLARLLLLLGLSVSLVGE